MKNRATRQPRTWLKIACLGCGLLSGCREEAAPEPISQHAVDCSSTAAQAVATRLPAILEETVRPAGDEEGRTARLTVSWTGAGHGAQASCVPLLVISNTVSGWAGKYCLSSNDVAVLATGSVDETVARFADIAAALMPTTKETVRPGEKLVWLDDIPHDDDERSNHGNRYGLVFRRNQLPEALAPFRSDLLGMLNRVDSEQAGAHSRPVAREHRHQRMADAINAYLEQSHFHNQVIDVYVSPLPQPEHASP